MKNAQFSVVSAHATYSSLKGNRGVVKSNSYYVFGESGLIGDQLVYRTTNLTSAPSTEHTTSPADANTSINSPIIHRLISGTIYRFFIFTDSTTIEIVQLSSADDGDTWTENKYTQVITGTTAYPLDIFLISGTVYYAYSYDGTLIIKDWANVGSDTDTSGIISLGTNICGGYVEDNLWYYALEFASNVIKRYSYDPTGPTFALVDTIYTAGAGFQLTASGILWKQDDILFLGFTNYFLVYDDGIWTVYQKSGNMDGFGVIWASNDEIKYVFLDRRAYMFQNNKVLLFQQDLLQNTSNDIFHSGWDDWVRGYDSDESGNRIWQIGPSTTKNGTAFTINKDEWVYEYGRVPRAWFLTKNNFWTIGEYILIYDDDDVLVFQGYIGKSTREGTMRRFPVIHPAYYDLQKTTYTGTLASGVKWSTFLKDNIIPSCKFLTEGTINTGDAVVSDDIIFNEKSLLEIFLSADDDIGNRFYINPDLSINWDDNTTDTTVNVITAIINNRVLEQLNTPSIITVRGGIVDTTGVRAKDSARVSTIGYGPAFFTATELKTDALCLKRAEQLRDTMNVVYLRWAVTWASRTFIQYCNKVTFTSTSDLGVSAQEVFVRKYSGTSKGRPTMELESHIRGRENREDATLANTDQLITNLATTVYDNDDKLGRTFHPLNTDAAAWSYVIGDFGTSASWTDKDVSAIVTDTDAVAIRLLIAYRDNNGASYVQFRKNGNSNGINAPTIRGQVANKYNDTIIDVDCDTSQVIEYYRSGGTVTNLNVLVIGFWK